MTKRAPDTYSLVADIGGTNTRVALAQGAQLLTETVRKYRNADFSDLETVLSMYISEEDGVDCLGACVALAGPVRAERGIMTNLDWEIDEATLARATRAQNVRLLNDLQAQGHAIGHLPNGSVRELVAGSGTDTGASKLVIGVGTGFNIAPVFETPNGRYVPAAEAGHADLPAHSDEELGFVRDYQTRHGFPAVEDMLSGRGLERVYAWQAATQGDASKKSAAEIMSAFEDGSDPLARSTAQIFVKMLGRVAGNLALNQLPFGGIYFAGGVARALSVHFEALGFQAAFNDKGRFAEFMQNFSVHVIEDDFAALTGCATYLEAQ